MVGARAVAERAGAGKRASGRLLRRRTVTHGRRCAMTAATLSATAARSRSCAASRMRLRRDHRFALMAALIKLGRDAGVSAAGDGLLPLRSSACRRCSPGSPGERQLRRLADAAAAARISARGADRPGDDGLAFGALDLAAAGRGDDHLLRRAAVRGRLVGADARRAGRRGTAGARSRSALPACSS